MNDMQRLVGVMKLMNWSNKTISDVVAGHVMDRGKIGTGLYACSCNNWGPRWGENSANDCCPGCFNWALDHHYEVPTSKLDPNRVTREMIEKNTWGINVKQLYKNKVHKIVDNVLSFPDIEI